MKTPSLELHELIHSLKPSEKRYFKLEASKHNSDKKNKYLSLFEAVEKQKEYNETELLIFF